MVALDDGGLPRRARSGRRLDGGEAPRRERPGTDALVVGDVDRVQMRAETTDGSTPPDLKLAVIDPGTGAMTKEAPAIDTAKLDSPRATSESSAGEPAGALGSGTGARPTRTCRTRSRSAR